MKLNNLLNIAGINTTDSVMDCEVNGLSLDSREIQKGYIFFSIKGSKTDGRKYLNQAIDNGACFIIAESKYKNDYSDIRNILFVDNIRQTMAIISNYYYGNPSKKLKVVGITGTNGKTTISYIIKSILEEAGFKCGLIGTINYMVGNENIASARLTTPDSIELNKMLCEMVSNGVEYCIMEVSSIALSNYRVHGIEFESAIFTNLTSEHMDLHNNMENYFEAKKILFDNLKTGNTAISNSDDLYGIKILENCKGNKKFYSINSDSDLKAEEIKITLDGLKFKVTHNKKGLYCRIIINRQV